MENLVDIGLWAAIIMVIVGGAAAIIMPIINSLSNPKSLLYSVIGIAALAIIYGIAYAISGDEVTSSYITNGVSDPQTSKIVGGGLTMTMILFILAAIGVAFSEVYKAFN